MTYLLKNGNKPFDLRQCKLCGARKRKNGEPCRAKAMKNGRCRIHGGKYSPPKTKEALERRNKANFRSGLYTKEMLDVKLTMREINRESRNLFKQFFGGWR